MVGLEQTHPRSAISENIHVSGFQMCRTSVATDCVRQKSYKMLCAIHSMICLVIIIKFYLLSRNVVIK